MITSYDQLPYQSQPFPLSHPDHLAAVALLYGLEPAPVGNCRVLELGCASGNNILPMALLNPKSTFVGVDRSSSQIAQGLREIKDLGITNLQLLNGEFTSVDSRLGSFDYVICHGIFSWISKTDQMKLLEVCRNSLAPGGVVYISYNTYPGWHFRNAVREMLLFATNGADNPEEKLGSARAAAAFFAQSVKSNDKRETAFVRSLLESIDRLPDWYLFHDILETDNYPCYFTDFVEQAEQYGLFYLTDADPASLSPKEFPVKVRHEIARLNEDPNAQEQLLDFLRLRLFRQSVLCSQNIDTGKLDSKRLSLLSVALTVPINGSVEAIKATDSLSHQQSSVGTPSADQQAMVQSLIRLGQSFPQALPFAQLLTQLYQDLSQTTNSRLEQRLVDALIQMWHAGLIRFSVTPPRPAIVCGQHPKAYELARRQAKSSSAVTNLWHELIELDQVTRDVLILLDGRRSLDQLEQEIALLIQGKGYRAQNGLPVTTQTVLDEVLSRLVKAALLLPDA